MDIRETVDANTNYISMACQVPLWELLQGIPIGMQLGMEMKDSEGTVYGHHHIPIGKHCHDAAGLLAKYEEALREITKLHLGGIEFAQAAGWAAVERARKALSEVKPPHATGGGE